MTDDLPLFQRNISRLNREFMAFHGDNPQVYKALTRFAREWKGAGKDRIGVKCLYERVRWELSLSTTGEFKLNNNYTAFYARLIMAQEPDLKNLFTTRRQKCTP